MVPLCLLIACSQRNGFCTNATCDISTFGQPKYNGCKIPPINPMSWYIGSQNTPTPERVFSNA
jgi:hypothetical protein